MRFSSPCVIVWASCGSTLIKLLNAIRQLVSQPLDRSRLGRIVLSDRLGFVERDQLLQGASDRSEISCAIPAFALSQGLLHALSQFFEYSVDAAEDVGSLRNGLAPRNPFPCPCMEDDGG